MLTNPGFSFVGVSGQHIIIPTSQTDLPIWGPIYEETVLCHYDDKLVTVYQNGPGFNYTDHSVVIEFASINLKDNRAILKFCDKYGMPGAMRQQANFRNDYIFFNSAKDEFSKSIPFGRPKEVTWLGTIKKEIARLQLTIELNQAITEENIKKIINIITYFCLDLSVLDFEGTQRSTESFQFNHHFFRYAEDSGYNMKLGSDTADFTNYLQGFLDDIDADFNITKSYHAHGTDYPSRYTQIYHSMWQHLHVLFTWLLKNTSIENIEPFGQVVFNPTLDTLDLSDLIKEKDHLINTAKGLLADIFKENLHRVYPEVSFTKENQLETSWRIPSLSDAMYLELFFRLTPTSTVKKCLNPTCPGYFQWSSSKPTKIYCAPECAELMAKRMQREREKCK